MHRVALLALLLLAAPSLARSQEAPLLTVLPRAEQIRQLEVRADLHMLRKQYPEAVDAYLQAVRLDARNAVLLNKTGIALQLFSRLNEARKYYERATKSDDGYAQAWNNLGTVYYGQKNYKKAIRFYREALKWDASLAATHSNLGAALFARRRFDEALREFARAMELNPNIFLQHEGFGILLQDTTVEDRARFHFLVAKSYAQMNLPDQCLLFLRRALEYGFSAEEARRDPAFAALLEDSRFQELFAQPVPAMPR